MYSFNEKIKFLVQKENVTELKCLCADKISLRDYCVKKIGWDLCPKIVYIFPDDNILIPKSILDSKKKYMIKCNHDCGSVSFIDFNNITDLKLNEIKGSIKRKLHRNYAFKYNEYQYHSIKPKAYIEEFIDIKKYKEVKFYCFNGKCCFIEVLIVIDWYNPKLDLYNSYDIQYKPFEFRIKRKDYTKYKINNVFYDELVNNYVNKLAEPFDFVRVDLYIDDENKSFYLSELTFSPAAGNIQFISKEMDKYFGELIDVVTLK